MICFGNVPAGTVLPVIFDSFAGSTGASITLTGLAVTDIEVYKGTSMTQRASDAGFTLIDTDGIDLDGITGIHGFSIDTGDNTDAGFYAAGSFYTVVVSSVTIDGQTVNFVAATFRLVAAENIAGVPAVDAVRLGGTAQTGRDVGASVLLSSGTGTGQLDFTSGVVKSNVTQFGGTNATTSGGRPEVNTTHAAGTAWNSGAIGASTLASDVTTELQSGLATAANLATVAGYLDTEMAAVLAVTNKLDTALESDGSGGYQFTTLALENGPSGGGGGGGTDWTSDEKAVIRAVLGIPGSGTTPADPSTGILDTIRDAVAGVQSDTNDIQTRLPAALVSGRMDASTGAYQTGLAPPTANENADALLKRDWTAVTGEAARSVLNALRFLRNKWTIAGGTLTVKKEDDSTTAWTGAVTTASSDPVDSIDPT